MRKQPQQARSRTTVDAVVEAGAQVLGRAGWSGFNTNHVAKVAGVSIGTVYQYFPNKLVLVEAIRRRHFDEILMLLERVTEAKAPLGERVRRLVDGMIRAHDAGPALHRALLEEAPTTTRNNTSNAAFENAYLEAYVVLLRGSKRRANPHLTQAARVLAAAVEGAVHDGARMGTLNATVFREELERLILCYLR